MDKQRRYTAQELREMACHLIDICDAENECNEYRNTIGSFGLIDCESALRQAADTEEELAKLNESKNRWMQYQETAAGERNACIDELRKKDAEIAQLRAQREAVQKSLDKHRSCHKCKSYPHCDGSGCISAVVEITNILRAARGEGSANM